MTNILAATILASTYLFTVVPLVGRIAAIGEPYRVSYSYDECMKRGLKIHIFLLWFSAVVWALTVV